jgi:peptidoglycan/xylan/chitin deacetylase (PgdA/CDA1 family)
VAYSFDQVFAADPANPSNIAQNASILIYQPGDATKTPLVITDPSGGALSNPVTVNANGFGPAFAHATLDRVAWDGGGFTGFFTSYEGMKAEAVAARSAAESAAANAAAEAQVAIGTATEAATTAASEAEAAATAAANSAALVGAPADTAIAAAVNGSGTATKAALNATFGPDAQAASRPLKDTFAAAKVAFPALRPPQPLVVFTFDDSPATDKNIIIPMLDAKGLKGVFCAMPSYVASNIGWATLRAWRDNGHEIVNHSATHADLSAASAATLNAEINVPHQLFLDNGITPTGFCWPYNNSSTASRTVTRSLYRYALGGPTARNSQPLHTHALRRIEILNGSTLATHTATIDTAITNNELLIFLIHSGGLDSATQAVLSQVMDYAKASAAKVVTASQAMDLMGNIVDTGDYTAGTAYTLIDGSGKFQTTSPGVLGRDVYGVSLNPAALPNTFAPGKVSYSEISSAMNTWPGGGVVGQVITDRTEMSHPTYTLQTYSSNGRIWHRRASSETAWGGWSEVGVAGATHKVGTPSATATDALAGTYATGTTITQVTNPGSTAPGGQPGLLITHRYPGGTYDGYTVQEFHAYQGGAMSRRMSLENGTGWTVWKTVTLT